MAPLYHWPKELYRMEMCYNNRKSGSPWKLGEGTYILQVSGFLGTALVTNLLLLLAILENIAYPITAEKCGSWVIFVRHQDIYNTLDL